MVYEAKVVASRLLSRPGCSTLEIDVLVTGANVSRLYAYPCVLQHKEMAYVKRGHERLAKLIEMCGLFQVNDSEEFHDIPFVASIVDGQLTPVGRIEPPAPSFWQRIFKRRK